jgi:hypothetical protein
MGVNYQTIRKFSQDSGYSEDAIRAKINRGVWRESEVWTYAPDGRVLISVRGYEAWVESQQRNMSESASPRRHRLRSSSASSAPGVMKGSKSPLPFKA